MHHSFTPEQIAKARACTSPEELISLAKGNRIELTEGEARSLFAQLHPADGRLSDEELERIAGGCGYNCGICKDGTYYCEDDERFDIIEKSLKHIKVRCKTCGTIASYDTYNGWHELLTKL